MLLKTIRKTKKENAAQARTAKLIEPFPVHFGRASEASVVYYWVLRTFRWYVNLNCGEPMDYTDAVFRKRHSILSDVQDNYRSSTLSIRNFLILFSPRTEHLSKKPERCNSAVFCLDRFAFKVRRLHLPILRGETQGPPCFLWWWALWNRGW